MAVDLTRYFAPIQAGEWWIVLATLAGPVVAVQTQKLDPDM
jgi:hypothetical protein